MYEPNTILKVILLYDTLDQVRIINQLARENKISATVQEQLLKAVVKQ